MSSLALEMSGTELLQTLAQTDGLCLIDENSGVKIIDQWKIWLLLYESNSERELKNTFPYLRKPPCVCVCV